MPAKKQKLQGPAVFPTADPQTVTLIDTATGERVWFDLRDGPVEFDDGVLGEVAAADDDYTADAADVAPGATYESWTAKELAAELTSRGLPSSGSKDEQMSRLEADDVGATAEAEA